MTAETALNGPMLPAASGTTKSIVILLHGYGADGNDLIGLAPHFARALPDTAFYSPNAPFPCEMSPFGRQWFSLAEYDPEFLRRQPETMSGALRAMAEGAAKNAAYIDSFIDTLLAEHDLPADKLALIGFSQGTMMALQTAPAPRSGPGWCCRFLWRASGRRSLCKCDQNQTAGFAGPWHR